MSAVVTVLHVIASIFLIAVVLLQRGKGAQIGAVFGGGASSTLFGSRGAGSFLSKLTAGAAAVFMLTSLSLSYFGITDASERLFEEGTQTEEPAEESLFEEVGEAPAEEPTVEAEEPAAAVEVEAPAPAPPAETPAAPAGDAAPAPDAG
jgi:preprotein translocase subunit SecG